MMGSLVEKKFKKKSSRANITSINRPIVDRASKSAAVGASRQQVAHDAPPPPPGPLRPSGAGS